VYIVKIKGKAKIPDYVQLRDDNFTLIAYFRTDRPERALDKCGLLDKQKRILAIIEEIPFGKIKKIEL
jgi:O6-methylguanine-DNA--protein-cysteine methyltransferase